MNISRIFASALTGAAAAAAIAAPALASGPADAQDTLESTAGQAGSILNAVTSEAGVEWGFGQDENFGGPDMGDEAGGTASGDFGSSYGDAVFYDKHSSLVASYGAPLVNVDARCVDAMGGIGGYANSVLGNSAKCNLKDVTQIDDSNGLIG